MPPEPDLETLKQQFEEICTSPELCADPRPRRELLRRTKEVIAEVDALVFTEVLKLGSPKEKTSSNATSLLKIESFARSTITAKMPAVHQFLRPSGFSPTTFSTCDGVFSTDVHSFAQIFCGKSIDGVNENAYLPRQIEPEEKDLTVRLRSGSPKTFSRS